MFLTKVRNFYSFSTFPETTQLHSLLALLTVSGGKTRVAKTVVWKRWHMNFEKFAILLMFRHLSVCVALHIKIYTLDHFKGCRNDIYFCKFNTNLCFTRENIIYIELPPRLSTADRKRTSLHRGFLGSLLNAPKPAC